MIKKPASGGSEGFRVTASFPMERATELLAVFIVLQSAFGLVALRAHCFNAVPIWVLSLLATYGYAELVRRRRGAVGSRVPLWHVVAVVGVGLIFRLPPFEWILGGQDQGVYMNMAMELARTGALSPIDTVLPHLADTAMRDLYLQSNYSPDYLPGVYSRGEGLTFQFYHLFPVWLALFAGSGDPGTAVYGLTFLSLVSLLAFYRLALLLSGSEKAAFVGAMILAVNPLHAFFSKFPVTEVPTLAFSLLSFGFLASCLRREDNGVGGAQLGLSIATLGLVFLTRISGFMYMPFLYCVSIAAVVLLQDQRQRRVLFIWSAAGAWLYALSVLYGLEWSRPYSMDIYQVSFGRVFGARWLYALAGIAVIASVAWVLVLLLVRSDRMAGPLKRIASLAISTLPFVGALVFVLGLYKAYKLGFTDAYAMNEWEGRRFQLAGSGWRGFFSASLVVSAVYLSPFLWVALVPGLFLSRQPYLRALSFFVIAFLGYIAVLQWVVPYQPYYARYLVSEFVPYVILLVVCVWAALPAASRPRLMLSWLLALGFVWSIGLSSLQLGKEEHGGVTRSIESLVEGVDTGDAVVVVSPFCCNLQGRLATTLSFSHGMNVVRLDRRSSDFKPFLDRLDSQYDDVYLVTDASVEELPGGEKLRSVRLNQEAFVHGALPPIKVHTGSTQLNVFKYASSQRVLFGAKGAVGAHLAAGWNEMEAWGVWSSGKAARIRIDTPALSSMRARGGEFALELGGRAFVVPQHPTQRISVYVGDRLVAEGIATVQRPNLRMRIEGSSLSGGEAAEIEIRIPDAVSPASLGVSGDVRVLGFGLESLVAVERTN